MLHQGVQAPEEIFREVRFASRPLLDPQQSLPVSPDLIHVAFPALQAEALAGDSVAGFRQSQPVPFDARGVMGRPNASSPAELGLDGRWKRDLLDDRARRFDLQEMAKDGRRQYIARLPGNDGAVSHPQYIVMTTSCRDRS
jgi:hypothetical protein